MIQQWCVTVLWCTWSNWHKNVRKFRNRTVTFCIHLCGWWAHVLQPMFQRLRRTLCRVICVWCQRRPPCVGVCSMFSCRSDVVRRAGTSREVKLRATVGQTGSGGGSGGITWPYQETRLSIDAIYRRPWAHAIVFDHDVRSTFHRSSAEIKARSAALC